MRSRAFAILAVLAACTSQGTGTVPAGPAQAPGDPPATGPSPAGPSPEAQDPSPAFVPAQPGACLPPLESPRAAALAAGRICDTASGFCFEHPLPIGNDLSAVFAFPGEVWVAAPFGAGGDGTKPSLALRFDGTSWHPVDTPILPLAMTAPGVLWGAGPGVDVQGYAVGTLARWDGATLWTTPTPGLGPFGIAVTAPDDVWAISSTHNGTFGVDRWDGGAWMAGNASVPQERMHSVSASGPANAWVMVSSPSVLQGLVHFDGAGWAPRDPGMRDRFGTTLDMIVRTRAADDTWVFGSPDAAHFDGTAWTRYDAGLGFGEPAVTPGSAPIRDAWWSGPDDLWAVGSNGTIVHFDGASFEHVDAGVRATLTGVSGTRSDDVWAVGLAGTILHWDGARWAIVSTGGGMDLRDAWGMDDADVWAVGDVILHRDGIGWRPAAAPPWALRSIHGSGPSDAWAVGDAGTALHWDGTCWRPLAVPTSFGSVVDLTAVWAASADAVFAAGNARAPADGVARGVVLRWDGTGWRRIHERQGFSPTAIRGSSADDVWFASYFTTLHLEGGAFTQVPLYATGLVVRAADDVLAFDGSVVHRWNGTTVGELVALPPPFSGMASAARGPDAIWVAHGAGSLVRLAGASLQERALVGTPSQHALHAAWVSPSGAVYAVGDAGTVVARAAP